MYIKYYIPADGFTGIFDFIFRFPYGNPLSIFRKIWNLFRIFIIPRNFKNHFFVIQLRISVLPVGACKSCVLFWPTRTYMLSSRITCVFRFEYKCFETENCVSTLTATSQSPGAIHMFLVFSKKCHFSNPKFRTDWTTDQIIPNSDCAMNAIIRVVQCNNASIPPPVIHLPNKSD